jgi:hypothetical protein
MRVAGIAYQINWKQFKRGTSFFLPCLNSTEALEEVQRITKRLRYEVVCKVVIEDGIRGVRTWRV